MKHQSHLPNSSSSNMHDLPVQPPSACVDPSRACVGDHRVVVKEIARAQSLLTQLRAIVLPAMQADERSELVAQMFQDILDCSSKAMADLQVHHQSDDARADDSTLADDKKRVRRIVHHPDGSSKEDVVKPHHDKHKRRRRFADSVSLETPVPQYDGRQWRKYGQKNINTEKHPRSYYRCAYWQEQGCKATKTVQQQDESINGADHPAAMYTVVYYGQHTCKGSNNHSKDYTGIDGSGTKIVMQSSSSNGGRSASISGNFSDPCDHQSRCLEGNELIIINKCEDYFEENNMLDAFDMAGLASLELDELLRFGA